jgi:osmoprotectant transport system substrate-binding protein
MRSFRNGVRLAVVGLLFTAALAACGDNDDNNSSDTTAAQPKGSLTVAGSDFTEQDIVANIYAVALRAKGYTVTVKPHLGKRETVQPALQSGEVDLMPEYAASLLEYLKQGSSSGDINAEINLLKQLLGGKGLTVLDAAGAYDANALVVTKATADKYHLTKISDLTPIASQLSFGAPPECPTRPKCLIGYKATYGLNFKSVKALDVGGPISKKALTDGSVDVVQLLSSDVPENTVVLDDDKQLQGAENLIPVVRTSKNSAEVTAALNAVSKALTLDELIELNRKAAAPDKPDPAKLAEDWAKEYKLT